MAKPKQFTRPPKKTKPSKSSPETEDDFQEAADFEEDAGGKWRAGDPAKSGRAFIRALEIYDKGLQKHPSSFDLAYNKARLELEITQNAAIVESIGVPLEQLLRQTLQSHRVALKLDEENVDVRFNASQVLVSLAECLSEEDDDGEAVGLLHEALEMLSACLARQEMMIEQQNAGFGEEGAEEDGGVPLDEGGSNAGSDSPQEQSATIVNPVTPSDLLDTVQASLSALTTLASMVDSSGLQMLGDIAHQLTESKAPSYLSLLPNDQQDSARFAVGLARATFIAAFADAQYSNQLIELQTYMARLDTFVTLPGKDRSAHALFTEAQARSELVLSALDQTQAQPAMFPASECWKQLSTAQISLTAASKLTDEDAKERKAKVYESKADIELLRWRLASAPGYGLSEAVQKSAPTLLANSRTFYKGAVDHGKALGEDDVVEKATGRYVLVNAMAKLASEGAESSSSAGSAGAAGPAIAGAEGVDLIEVLGECVEEGLLSEEVADQLVERLQGA